MRERLDDGTHADEQVFVAIDLHQPVASRLHALEADLACADPLAEILDVQCPYVMQQGHRVEETALRSEYLELRHWDEHVAGPPLDALSGAVRTRRA